MDFGHLSQKALTVTFPVSRIPLWQAPTGSIAGPELCAAVCRAGGVGSMGLTWTSPENAAQHIHQVRSADAAAFFLVNFALAFQPLALEAALLAGAPCVAFSWGDPGPLVEQVHRAGALCGLQVGSPEGAKLGRKLGVDFLICQSMEAGGHVQSSTELQTLLPAVLKEAEEVPVVAAGGMANGFEAAHALRLGARAVMMGTRFVASLESRAHEQYKQAICRAKAGDTALTLCYRDGWPDALHRVLRNSTLRQWEAAGCPLPGRRPGENDVVAYSAHGEPLLRYEDTAPRSGMTGNMEALCCYAGTGAGEIETVETAEQIVKKIEAEMQYAFLMHSANAAADS